MLTLLPVKIVLILLYLFAACIVIRYFVHMLQLSSYQFQGYFRFLSQEKHRVLPLLFGVIPAAASLVGADTIAVITAVIYLAAMTFYYWPRKQKKKFVATARVKRLFVTIAIVTVLLALTCLLLPEGKRNAFIAILSILFIVLPLIVALGNLINKPIEKAVQNYYINDAKKILESHPGLTIIGITGSYGKTSVKYYLTTLLAEKYRVLMTPSSFNTPMGVVRTIREQLEPTHQVFVCEMGARHVGDIKEICDIVHPQHGIVTSIGYQHLETFHSIENIIGTKYELLDEVASNGKGGMKFVNGNNTFIKTNMKYPEAITYGTDPSCAYHGEITEVTNKGTSFTVTAPDGETGEFRMSLLGQHNVENVIGAIAAAHELGVPMNKLKMGVRRLEGVPHRLQLINRGSMVTVIDDAYNANPDGTKAALDTLGLFDGTLRILVTPGMVELGEKQDEENAKFGANAAAVCDYILLVGERNTRSIRQGAEQAGFPADRLFTCANLAEATKLMYELESGKPRTILLENDLPDNYL